MPIYEYECNRCHEVTEALQKFSDPPLRHCPHCNGRLQKLMSLNSFHLKGSGWYVTDYAGKKPGSQAEKSEPDKKAAEKAGSEGKKSASDSNSSSQA